MFKVRTLVVLALVQLPFVARAYDPREVIRQVNLQNSPVHEKADFTMVLVDSSGGKTIRTGTQFFRRKSTDKPESTRLFRFHSPPEMAKSGVLLMENADKDNEQWIYLPATYSTRRIPARNRGDRYMGTDFSYEDAVSFRIEEYAFTALDDEAVDGTACRKVEQKPVEKKLVAESIYSRIVQWVDAEKNVVLRAEYFDKEGKLLKTYRAAGVVQAAGAWRANHFEIEDHRLKHKTVVDITDRDCSTPLREAYFTTRSLERPE